MKKTLRFILAVALLALALAVAFYLWRERPAPGPPSGKLIARFLDVGQGDCQLVQLPGGQTILIDSGEPGSPTVELLSEFGVREIELAVATHPHADHVGEMRDVMRRFGVKEFWDSGFPHPTKTYSEMLEEIRDRRITFKTPKRGEARQFGEVLLEVLNPGPSPPVEEANNASLVLRLTYRNRRFLFTGDAELAQSPSDRSAWDEMMRTAGERLRADLLKAAHHGSADGTDQRVLDLVQPSFVTISCQAGNDYHHPHPSVVRLLESRAHTVRLCRTDLEGTITVTTDGTSLEVSTERSVPRHQLYLTGDEVARSRLGGQSQERSKR